MLASVTLYLLWLFMTVFMLAVVVAGGRKTQTRRRVRARKNAPQLDRAGAVSFTCEQRASRP